MEGGVAIGVYGTPLPWSMCTRGCRSALVVIWGSSAASSLELFDLDDPKVAEGIEKCLVLSGDLWVSATFGKVVIANRGDLQLRLSTIVSLSSVALDIVGRGEDLDSLVLAAAALT